MAQRSDGGGVLARAGYSVALPSPHSHSAATAAAASAPDCSLPWAAGRAPRATPTAAALVRHAQRSGAVEGWLREMEGALRAESDGCGGGGEEEMKEEAGEGEAAWRRLLPADASAAALAALQPAVAGDADAPLCPLELRLLARMLASAEADPSLRALLREAEGGDGHAAGPAPPSLSELVRRAGQLCARTILDPLPPPAAASRAHTHSSHSRAVAAAAPHPSSVLPELRDRCAAAYRAVAHAPARPSDPAHPSDWSGAEGDLVRAAVGAPLLDSRADRLLSAAAEDLLRQMQTEGRT